jgi:hypothetical protein
LSRQFAGSVEQQGARCQNHQRAATARQQAALGRWQKKLQITSKTDKKHVHSWLRGGLSQVPKAFKDEHG